MQLVKRYYLRIYYENAEPDSVYFKLEEDYIKNNS